MAIILKGSHPSQNWKASSLLNLFQRSSNLKDIVLLEMLNAMFAAFMYI